MFEITQEKCTQMALPVKEQWSTLLGLERLTVVLCTKELPSCPCEQGKGYCNHTKESCFHLLIDQGAVSGPKFTGFLSREVPSRMMFSDRPGGHITNSTIFHPQSVTLILL